MTFSNDVSLHENKMFMRQKQPWQLQMEKLEILTFHQLTLQF